MELELAERMNPYLCECEDEGCTTIVLLTSKEYEEVRSGARHFLLASRFWPKRGFRTTFLRLHRTI